MLGSLHGTDAATHEERHILVPLDQAKQKQELRPSVRTVGGFESTKKVRINQKESKAYEVQKHAKHERKKEEKEAYIGELQNEPVIWNANA